MTSIDKNINNYEKLKNVDREDPLFAFIGVVFFYDLEEAFNIVSRMKGVPEEVAEAFRLRYDPEGLLTPKQAFEKFYNEHK